MKKIIVVAVGLLVLAGIIVGIVMLKDKDSPSTSTTSSTNSSRQSFRPVDACTVFPLSEAKKVLGEAAEAGKTPGTAVSSDEVAVSTCVYTTAAATLADVKNMRSASLLVRSPKTAVGKQSNESQFGPEKPADAQVVNGYGEAAYWSPEFGQLNVLTKGHWLILSIGKARPADRTVDEAKKLADSVVPKI